MHHICVHGRGCPTWLAHTDSGRRTAPEGGAPSRCQDVEGALESSVVTANSTLGPRSGDHWYTSVTCAQLERLENRWFRPFLYVFWVCSLHAQREPREEIYSESDTECEGKGAFSASVSPHKLVIVFKY